MNRCPEQPCAEKLNYRSHLKPRPSSTARDMGCVPPSARRSTSPLTLRNSRTQEPGLFSIFASFLDPAMRRIAAVELEVPRDREGAFQTALFQRYQRSEKALVLTLMQAERAVQCSTSACGTRIQNLHLPPVERTWRECARFSVRRVLLPREYCSPL